MERLRYITNLVIVILLMATIAIQRDGNILGHKASELIADNKEDIVAVPIEETLSDGTRIINSTTLASDIIGFGGKTPVKLHVKDGIITHIETLANAETPSFWEQLVDAKFLTQWDNTPIEEAATMQVNAISGATYSSVALAGNVQRAAQYAADVQASSASPFSNITISTIAGQLVIILGAIITLGKFRNKWLITTQLILNVLVLGLWCGSFLSLSTFVAWVSNGVNLSLSLVTFSMFIVIVIMPLFNRNGSYCHIYCPLGSAQELVGRIPSRKIKLSPATNKILNQLRYYILLILLFIMWLGLGFELMNYELFSAFIFTSASNVVLVLAAIVLILSSMIQRPYCRFICPTGALITMSQKTSHK